MRILLQLLQHVYASFFGYISALWLRCDFGLLSVRSMIVAVGKRLPHVPQPPPLSRVSGPRQVTVLRVRRDSQHLHSESNHTESAQIEQDQILTRRDSQHLYSESSCTESVQIEQDQVITRRDSQRLYSESSCTESVQIDHDQIITCRDSKIAAPVFRVELYRKRTDRIRSDHHLTI